MPIILNIETSSKICSVAISVDGQIEYHIESDSEMNHAVCLAPYIERCLSELERKEQKLDAVAVSIGPGSYTGLRIGLSMAKGICFAQNIPLIGVSTLKLLAVKAMFKSFDWTGEELLVPMIDARRMEVYTAVYNFRLEEIVKPIPMILDDESFKELLDTNRLIFNGDGSEKAKEVIKSDNALWTGYSMPLAMDMTALSEMALRNKDFIDIAYATPEYLKEYQVTKSKNKVLGTINS